MSLQLLNFNQIKSCSYLINVQIEFFVFFPKVQITPRQKLQQLHNQVIFLFSKSRNNSFYTFFCHTRYSIECFISDYTYHVGQTCLGNKIGNHATLQAAKAACSNNVDCGCIYDSKCNGDGWSISKGNKVTQSRHGTCAWARIPSKLTCPFHTRTLIYYFDFVTTSYNLQSL